MDKHPRLTLFHSSGEYLALNTMLAEHAKFVAGDWLVQMDISAVMIKHYQKERRCNALTNSTLCIFGIFTWGAD